MNKIITQDSYYSFKCFIASFLATYATAVLHPLQVIKTRFQSHDGKQGMNVVPQYKGIWNALRTIYQQQGVLGLYKGVHLTIFSTAAATSLFFWMYQHEKLKYINNNYGELTAVTIAGLETGVLGTILTQPIWVAKTRVILNTVPGISQTSNLMSAMREIHQQNGYIGFFKGFSLSLLLSVNGAGQMLMYEIGKLLYDRFLPQSIFGQKNFFCGAFAKTSMSVVVYPVTTVRTRIQQNQYVDGSKEEKYKNIRHVLRKTWADEGIRGFYKGLGVGLARGVPQKGMYFYFYQLIKNYLCGQNSSKN